MYISFARARRKSHKKDYFTPRTSRQFKTYASFLRGSVAYRDYGKRDYTLTIVAVCCSLLSKL